MKFSVVTESLAKLESISSRLKITEELAELFKKASPAESEVLSYLLLGDLHPAYRGTVFGLAEKNMTSMLGEAFGDGGEDEHQASFIGGGRRANTGGRAFAARVKRLGDLGEAVEETLLVVRGAGRDGADPLMMKVYEALVEIEQVAGEGSQERKGALLVALLNEVDASSARYVVRIILGKLRLGFSDMTLLDALSWMKAGDKSYRDDLEAAYNVSADIGLLAKTLKDGGITAVREMHARPGVPVRPAAAERLESAEAIIEKLGKCAAQPKLDGLRLQVHSFTEDGSQVIKFFSRNLQDVTHMFPDLEKAVKKLTSSRFIIEGEAIAFDAKTGRFLPFQETAKRRRKTEVVAAAESRPMRLYLFDCLFENRSLVLDEPHTARRERLQAIVGAATAKSTVQVIDEQIFDDLTELEAYFQEQIDCGLEGIIAKRLDAPYKAGKRNFNWIKLKRLETGSLEDTVDCVVLGYYRGRGKRAEFGIGALLVGVFNDKKDRFESVAKIGTGLSDTEWRAYKKMCDSLAVHEQPHNVDVAKGLIPDIWVTPKEVIIIRADEISRSPLHSAGATAAKGGLALRFPRVMGRREDKSARDATTVEELEHLRQLQEKKRRG